jgi:arsenical pump membrane protein
MRATHLESGRSELRWSGPLAVVGVVATVVALVGSPHDARAAAAQTWSPFVLVAGLLLIGLVAEEDGLFTSAGGALAKLTRRGIGLYLGATALIVVVTATLNLDTSVVFVTPVLIAAARRRGTGERPFLYGSLLLANASSLFLPGSNLTNLIVLGHQPLTGSAFLALMWPAAVTGCAVTAGCIAVWARRDLVAPTTRVSETEGSPTGLGAVAALLAIVLVVALRSPAVPILIVGVVAVVVRVCKHRVPVRRAAAVLGVPVLLGLFGITIGLGTLGRLWSGPATLLAHVGGIGGAVVAAILSVLVNNLPAASLLAARHPHHAAQLLVGLNLGPNLFVSGSLAWFLWLRVARASGATPSIGQAARIGVVVVPLSMAAALAALVLAGSG